MRQRGATLARENFKKAYELRERVSQREKYEITTSYFQGVTGELEKAAQQYELLIHDYPRAPSAHNNLGAVCSALGQHERAADLFREALLVDQDASTTYANLALEYMALNRLDEAKAILDQALARKLDVYAVRFAMYHLAFLQNDPAAMREQVAWARSKPGSEDYLLYLQSRTEGYYGRLQKAREFTRQAVDSAMHNDAKEVAANYEAYAAVREAEFGDMAQAHQEAAAALALFPEGQDVRLWAALALAQIGDAQQSQVLVDRLNNDFPNDTVMQGYWLPSLRAAVEVVHGNASKAVELLQAASSYELGGPAPLLPAFVRGQAHLLARNGWPAPRNSRKSLTIVGWC